MTPSENLKLRISELEILRAEEGILLKAQLMKSYESLKPMNLIKKTLSDLVSAPDLKGNLLESALSLAAGHLTKRAVVGSTSNPIKNLFGTFLQMAVTSIVSKNAGSIKSGISSLTDLFLKKENSER